MTLTIMNNEHQIHQLGDPMGGLTIWTEACIYARLLQPDRSMLLLSSVVPWLMTETTVVVSLGIHN